MKDHRSRHRDSRGQSLVEFSLVLLPFIILIVSILEFGFMFAAYNSISFASHDGSQMAAEYGNTSGADGLILRQIDQDISAPANNAQIVSVDIYWVDTAFSDGRAKAGYENLWTYGGSTTFTLADGVTTYTVPFSRSSNGYPDTSRCNVNGAIGCANPPHTGVDTIGVTITYQYKWITPFPQLVFGNSGAGPKLVSTNIMRLEPIR
jgi:hypothetical protein